MAHASKSRSPRVVTTATAKQIAAQLVTGEGHWHDSARALVSGLLVADPKGENVSPRRRPKAGSVAVFDPFATIDPSQSLKTD